MMAKQKGMEAIIPGYTSGNLTEVSEIAGQIKITLS
jgi:hypothetical protein